MGWLADLFKPRDPYAAYLAPEYKVQGVAYRDAFPDETIISRFVRRMNAELAANRHKPDWRGLSLKDSLGELKHHQKKLIKATKSGDAKLIKEYAADVANCAMFVAWSAGGLYEEDDSPGNQGVVYTRGWYT